jgi:hypothetical protein
MTTRPYSELLAQVQALAGVDDFAAAENARVKIFANRRARKAYAESELWPRFLKTGEERIVSAEGLLPYTQTGLDTIGTIYRIHATEPFKTEAAGEYVDWNTQSDGIQITGYQASAHQSLYDNLTIGGSPNPDISGTMIFVAGTFDEPQWTLDGEASYPGSGTWWSTGFAGTGADRLWSINIFGTGTSSGWDGDNATETIDGVESWSPSGDSGGTLTVSISEIYSAFVTYKAALPTTYGDGDGEESDVPEEWFEYMAQGAYTDFLRSDDKAPERVIIEETIASELLEQQLAKISRQNGAHLQTRILSHGSMQNR